ncbi:MAG TPA: hypothetical protein DCS05_00400 [Nitrospiraceae bacterium]|nr:hypothetical protein [Nitrospiraceae bacterium]
MENILDPRGSGFPQHRRGKIIVHPGPHGADHARLYLRRHDEMNTGSGPDRRLGDGTQHPPAPGESSVAENDCGALSIQGRKRVGCSVYH